VRRTLGESFRFVELANDVNAHMPDYVVRRLVVAFNRMGKALKGSRVLLLGLAYKANTGDAREAPGTVIAERLAALGAEVHVADPHLAHDTHGPFTLVELCAEELEEADGVVLVTDHGAFDYDLVTARAAYVLDTRGRLDGPNVERL
jgi:UDP-N-acetyl-D-glucosamine dehydrogenase